MALFGSQSGAAALVPRPTGAPEQEGIGTMAELDVYAVEINGYAATVQLTEEDAKARGLKASDKASVKAAKAELARAEKEAQELADKEAADEREAAEKAAKAEADKAGKAPANKAVTSPTNKAATQA